jgi:hypothetical protein
LHALANVTVRPEVVAAPLLRANEAIEGACGSGAGQPVKALAIPTSTSHTYEETLPLCSDSQFAFTDVFLSIRTSSAYAWTLSK